MLSGPGVDRAPRGGREGPDTPAHQYVRLALDLARVLPGVLDAHLGDPSLEQVPSDAPDPARLAREADRLLASLPGSGLAASRAAFLDGQLRAVRMLAECAGGESPGFLEEIERGYGVRVTAGDPDRYREAHRALDGLLDGPGTLAARLAAFRERDRLPAEVLPAALETATAALRARTAAVVGLPADERVDLEVVDDAPWSGFSRRIGSRRSVVSVNRAAGHRVTHLPLLVAHEAYPGHHTEHCRTEAGHPPPERTVFVARTPQSLIAEGAAELGLDVVVGPGWGRWSAEVLAGVVEHVDPQRAALGEAIERVMADLAPVRQDAALMLHAQGRDPAEALAHLRRWLLVDEGRARRMLAFLAHPRWRTHTTTYVEGARLLRPWLWPDAQTGGDAVTERFVRLLDDPPSVETVLATARDRSAPARTVQGSWLRRTVGRWRATSGRK